MELLFLFSILTVCQTEGKVYHVKPALQSISCPGNSSCPPGQPCHTMDYLAEHSSEFFSPDQVSVTLVFMCGFHNYTKDLTVQNLHSFVMKGAIESRENVVIDHQFVEQNGEPNCTLIQFFNVSSVNITNLTMRCPAMNLKESQITVKNSNLYGYLSTNESYSFINIVGRSSLALLDNCTFKENCFIVSNFSDGIIVSNSTFQSYRHQIKSIIVVLSSVVTVTGNVNFTDSITGILPSYRSSGTAMFLTTSHPELKSSLHITTDANVYFVNLTCSNGGGAVYGSNAMILIGAKANVVFAYNSAGAVWLSNGTMIVDSEAYVTFKHNFADSPVSSGAVLLHNGKLIVNANANLNFSNNSAFYGGALILRNSTAHVNTNAGVQFYNNRGLLGGAVYFNFGVMYINSNNIVKFIENAARIQGGAIFIATDVLPSVIIGNYSKLLLFNNTAFQRGALYIVPSSFMVTVGYQSSIQFINNTAFDVGGAVYSQSSPPCIFMIIDYSANICFIGNHAQRGIGHHMYGASVRDVSCDKFHVTFANTQGKPLCLLKHEKADEYTGIIFDPGLNETLSPVSSVPHRVCLCDANGKPQCANMSYIFTNASVYRGEIITLPACIVGYDFGTTVGMIHASLLYSNSLSKQDKSQLVIHSERCFSFNYNITASSKHNYQLLLLQTSYMPTSVHISYESTMHDFYKYKDTIEHQISDYVSNNQHGCIGPDLLTTPIFINITLLPGCPPGLTLNNNATECSCYSVLSNGFQCSVQNKTGLLQWNSTVWVNATFNGSHSTGIIYNRFCPPYYCKSGNKSINIVKNPSKQCASNRTGILCGACMDNFSLAIGSSLCIECPNSHNMALLFAFVAAGVFLVLFILAFNLTVTQGFINGIIFYANIIWAYKIILFPSCNIGKDYLLMFLQGFVAWLNLDLGIETCFFVGLNAFFKTWLQFLFPFYIWGIAGVIIFACHYSFRLTNLIGSRAVPLLATLFLLSYKKLLCTGIDAISVAVITQYPQNTSYAVWYLDGNLRYCQLPHILLFLVAIVILVFLWLPYTLLLLFIQPLRRVSHLRLLKWIDKFAPVYDAYFSPLKDKHRYWFGTTLLVRGILLTVNSESVANPELKVFVLFLFIAFLCFFMSIKYVYKRMTVRLFESATLLNLIVLSAGTLYKWESTESRSTLLIVSIGITFGQFCVIIVLSLIKLCLVCLSTGWRCRPNQGYDVIDDDITYERIEDPELEPLMNYVSRPVTMAASAKYTT